MAQIREVRLIDDLDGGPANETVTFGLGGRWFEIDLSVEHAEQLRAGLAPFVEKARKPAANQGSVRTRTIGNFGTRRNSADEAKRREDNDAVRAWARSAGFAVQDRGRIPFEVLDAYRNRAGREQDKHLREDCDDLDACPVHGEVAPVSGVDKGTADVQHRAEELDAQIMAWVRENANGRKISASRTKPTMTELTAYMAIHDTASA